jgi:hypothetical protein
MGAEAERMTVAALAADDPKHAAFDAEQVDDDTSALGHDAPLDRSPERLRIVIEDAAALERAREADQPRGAVREQPIGCAPHLTYMLMILLIVVLILALGGGGLGHSRYGAAGWSPAGIILLVLLVLYFTGNLHV